MPVARPCGCLGGEALALGIQDPLLVGFPNQRRCVQLSTLALAGEGCSAGFWDHPILDVTIIFFTCMGTYSQDAWLPAEEPGWPELKGPGEVPQVAQRHTAFPGY